MNEKNIGILERIIRMTLGTMIITLGVLAPAPFSFIAYLAGLVVFTTGMLGICPAYSLAGISTEA